MEWTPWSNTTPMPTPNASYSSSKVWEKFGRARMDAWVNLSFKSLKAFSYFHPIWNVHLY